MRSIGHWNIDARCSLRHNLLERAREVYAEALQVLGDEFADEAIFMAFARFETRCRENERARVIYRYGVDKLGRDKAPQLYEQYTQFEKQHGDKEGVENVILQKRRFQYEEVTCFLFCFRRFSRQAH